ncbi:DNA mismatch endonuclease Vsr [Azotobacter chroococcum]|uniref:Very short patch repair endonuclease n=2 Tax=Azotobacter chroococcum TaxID=353 RepID=A0AA43Z419_9GAMM|nr:very short patch repair endonuclease [Azotobacter chroococcum]NHN75871.1 DNA mismatch endonuclease Vsr [Azotobacter chroococcum]
MRSVRRENTTPEIKVRKALHRLGYRFRLHDKSLPGSPDIVLKKFKTVIFVHGCFWHRHPMCKYTTFPKTRIEFWSKKFDANIIRDNLNTGKLTNMGWNVLIIWECQTKDPSFLDQLLLTLRPIEKTSNG